MFFSGTNCPKSTITFYDVPIRIYNRFNLISLAVVCCRKKTRLELILERCQHCSSSLNITKSAQSTNGSNERTLTNAIAQMKCQHELVHMEHKNMLNWVLSPFMFMRKVKGGGGVILPRWASSPIVLYWWHLMTFIKSFCYFQFLLKKAAF